MHGRARTLYRNPFQIKTMKTLLFIIFSATIYGQNIKSHQWKNRVIIISGDTKNFERVEKQFKIFQTNKQELLERKLVIYKCLKKTCKYYDWMSKPKEIQIKTNKTSFKIKLFGLDGGEKFKSEKLITSKQLFDLIDSMPMRKSEIRSKKH